MEGEDGLILQSLVIPEPGFTVIVRAPQARGVIGAGVEHARLNRIGSNRQCEGVARQAPAEGLPAGWVGNPSYGDWLATGHKRQGDG